MRRRPDTMFILADDLSGAADCAVRAAGAGLSSVVLIDPSARVQADVIAVDADTRELPPGEAAVASAASWRTRAAPGTLFYKKIDSTLRGNFAAEMRALDGAGVAIVAPAFPGTGRTVRDGRVRVGGVPLEHTEVWAAAGLSGEADVVAMLRAQGLAAELVPLARVRGDLRAELATRVGAGAVQALVCDAETDDDLLAIAAASIGLPVYWVGSAGLAAHLPAAAGIAAHGTPVEAEVDGPALFVVGSRSSRSLEQARALEAGGEVAVFVAGPATLRLGEADAGWRAMRDAVTGTLAAGRDALVRIGHEGDADPCAGRALAASLARMLEPAAAHAGALAATGGETARAVLSGWGVAALMILREIEPGVALSRTPGPRPIAVITKAGAFGSPQALRRAQDVFDSLRRGPRVRRTQPEHRWTDR